MLRAVAHIESVGNVANHFAVIPPGPGYARSQAASITRMAGIAAALGHPVVPHLVQELGMCDYVLEALQRWDPRGAITHDFEHLLTKMHLLTGPGQLHGWTVSYDPAVGGMRWDTVPAGIDGTAPVSRQKTTLVVSAITGSLSTSTCSAQQQGESPWSTEALAAQVRDVEDLLAAGKPGIAADVLETLAAATTTTAASQLRTEIQYS